MQDKRFKLAGKNKPKIKVTSNLDKNIPSLTQALITENLIALYEEIAYDS